MAKVLMKGNEAIGEAAVRANCLNYFAYPITPQSEVAEYLARRLPEVGGNFLQGESEVAVGYMLFGASASGVRVFTTSSSPGISLMSEAISYMAAGDCPVVLVNIMRSSPGLGGILPSQADYFQATKGGGHGDYHIMVLAPNSVQEAVTMTMEAFNLAEKYRNPVMIMGDGLIGQMMEPVEFPEDIPLTPSNKDDWATNGMEFRNSDKRNLMKTLCLDGKTLHAKNMRQKAKYERMAREDMRYETYNADTDYEALLVSYGTTSRVCRTAIDNMRVKGLNVALLRPQTLFPFPAEPIREAALKPNCKVVISVELSAGQMVEDVDRAVQGRRPVLWYGLSGGEVPLPEDIEDFVHQALAENK